MFQRGWDRGQLESKIEDLRRLHHSPSIAWKLRKLEQLLVELDNSSPIPSHPPNIESVIPPLSLQTQEESESDVTSENSTLPLQPTENSQRKSRRNRFSLIISDDVTSLPSGARSPRSPRSPCSPRPTLTLPDSYGNGMSSGEERNGGVDVPSFSTSFSFFTNLAGSNAIGRRTCKDMKRGFELGRRCSIILVMGSIYFATFSINFLFLHLTLLHSFWSPATQTSFSGTR
jgi:hypothetical protein